jgi:hypothetical protein
MALAQQYKSRPDATLARAFDRALDHYRERLPTIDPLEAAWLVQAFAQFDSVSRRADIAQFVFDLADVLVSAQQSPALCESPELVGGVVTIQGTIPNIETAIALAALTDAVSVARQHNNQRALQRYLPPARWAARFVMQLQFRETEAYFVHSPIDVLGGVRTSPVDNRLRLDSLQHAIIGLMKFRDVVLAPLRRPD